MTVTPLVLIYVGVYAAGNSVPLDLGIRVSIVKEVLLGSNQFIHCYSK